MILNALPALVIASSDLGGCAIIGIIVIVILVLKNSGSNSSTTSSNSNYSPNSARTRMGSFEIRAMEVMRGDSNNIRVITIEARGIIPVYTSCDIDFVVFAMDTTDGKDSKPLYCTIERFQMPDSPGYRSYRKGLPFSPGEGFIDWVEVGVAPTDCLVAPKSGQRKLEFYAMAVRRAAESTKLKDFTEFASSTANIYVRLGATGYEEKNEKRVDAIKLSVQLGIAVAYADGNLAPAEGRAIKEWTAKQIEELPDDEQAGAKTAINETIRQAGVSAKAGQLNVASAAKALKESPLSGVEMQALELCVKVMATDGIIDPKELEIVRRIGGLLGITYEDIRNLTDKHPPAVNTQVGAPNLNDEQIAGIEPGLSPEDKRKEIRKLFTIYNARLSTEKDKVKRFNYQRKIEALARLKQKHG